MKSVSDTIDMFQLYILYTFILFFFGGGPTLASEEIIYDKNVCFLLNN